LPQKKKIFTPPLSQKPILKQKKNPNPPPPPPLQVKWSVPYNFGIRKLIFFNNIGNQNIFLEKNPFKLNGRSLMSIGVPSFIEVCQSIFKDI
jgi:hypothetical protein